MFFTVLHCNNILTSGESLQIKNTHQRASFHAVFSLEIIIIKLLMTKMHVFESINSDDLFVSFNGKTHGQLLPQQL